MHLNIQDVDHFMDVIHSCKGPVYLTDWRVDKNDEPNIKLNLKSQLSLMLGVKNLLSNHGDWFEIWTSNREDEAKMMEFIAKTEEKNN